MSKENLITEKKAVIYCRVSTKEQVEEGNSLKTQEKICTEYCLSNHYEVAKIFIEQGESAKTAERTELRRLLAFCADKKNQVKAIVIYKIDRLSRNTDDYSQLRLFLKRYDVEIKSTSEYFENNPVGRFMENTMANIAQFDNDIRTERSVGGMREAVREGRFVWNAPLGYCNLKVSGKSTIVPDLKTFPLMRQAFELLSQNKYTVEEVRQAMVQKGLVSRTGKPISKSFFYKAISKEIYTGTIVQFGERHKGTFEPLVSEELFLQVQRVLKNKGKKYISHITDHPDFPLRRFVQNEHGRKLTGSWSQGRYKKYPFYRFSGAKESYNRDKFEFGYMEFMDHFKFDMIHYQKLEASMRKKMALSTDIQAKQTESLKKHLEKLKEKEIALINKNLSGIISDSILKQHLDLIENEKMDINAILLNFSGDQEDFAGISVFVKRYLQNPSKIWKETSIKVKTQLQWFQFPSGIVFENNSFRTGDIANVFKLKSLISDYKSFNVHFEFLKSNNTEILNDELRHNFIKEIKVLTEILKEEGGKKDAPG